MKKPYKHGNDVGLGPPATPKSKKGWKKRTRGAREPGMEYRWLTRKD